MQPRIGQDWYVITTLWMQTRIESVTGTQSGRILQSALIYILSLKVCTPKEDRGAPSRLQYIWSLRRLGSISSLSW